MIGLHTEAQVRNLIVVSGAQENIFFRVGLHWYNTPSSMWTAGYGYFHFKPSDEGVNVPTINEHRIWQQYLSRKRTVQVFMEHRFRLEQRFLTNVNLGTQRLDHRIRYRFQLIFPFYTISPYLRHYFIAGYNEVMLNMRTNTNEIFDRNRLYGAIGYQVSPKLNFQIGYLNQYAMQPVFDNGEVNHLLQFTVAYNMDDLMRTFFIR